MQRVNSAWEFVHMEDTVKIEVPVAGMDCAGCARHVQNAIGGVDGVCSVEVLLSAERAVVEALPGRMPDWEEIRKAVQAAGYQVPPAVASEKPSAPDAADISRKVFLAFGLIVGAVLFAAVVGEWLGLFVSIQELIPVWLGAFVVVLTGWPVFRRVVLASVKGQVISHTLMAVGAMAALAVGQWLTAAVVVFFMRVGDYVETFTAERVRSSVRELMRLAPQKATVLRDGQEWEVPVETVQRGDVVVVRPGERIPVDGDVIDGQATVNQAAITGESMPVEVAAGAKVYAATLAQLGALRIVATGIGRDSTFGHIIRLVEEAETNRGPVQRIADKFSAYYLPVVAVIALLTFLLRGDLMAAVAVTVVACSCAFALATPVALLASIGAAARSGLVIKGGSYLEALSKADVVLLDKTGTLTTGKPVIVDVFALNGMSEHEVLGLAASAERYSEHPLGIAVREAARQRGIATREPKHFESLPGKGVHAVVDGHTVFVGQNVSGTIGDHSQFGDLESAGKTLFNVEVDGRAAAVLAAVDTCRGDVPDALRHLRRMGIEHIELLTGDREAVARTMAGDLGIDYRASLLPEDKIAVVKAYQDRGHTVVMIGDGVNDAPALAQADVGIAMGAAGTDVAVETASIVLLRDDWRAIPGVFGIARRTMGVIRLNIGFTAVYNIVGLTLAAFGILPPVAAAAAQSLPDIGIMLNSARLLRPDEVIA